MAGLYIHIPFCASRCIYCGFYSTTHHKMHDRYVDALCREMELRAANSPQRTKISTIYLGGGTPSQLSLQCLCRLFRYIYKIYDVDENAEVTMECNPDDISVGMFDGIPVNRVSMGIQTFNDGRLRFLHRRHNATQAKNAVATLRNMGIDNISIDLMFGFPNQTMEEWEYDIEQAVALNPEHISAYSLMYEEGTPLTAMRDKGKIREIDEDLSLGMYSKLIDLLTENGYEHYEISNFAKQQTLSSPTGRQGSKHSVRSRHNSSYWHDIPYIGIGAAAHSYDIKTRSWNVADIGKYIGSIEQGKLPSEHEIIDDDTHYDDIVTTAMRTCEGIDTAKLKPKYRAHILKASKKFIDDNLLTLNGSHIKLTRKGLFVSDMVMAELIF